MRNISNIPDTFIDLLKHPGTGVIDTLSQKSLIHLLKSLILHLKSKPSLRILGNKFDDTCIVGDIHGDLNTIKKILSNFLEEKINSLIFLGDYVDRGTHSLEILLCVYSLKLAFPNRICLLKGNHEDIDVNKNYGFYSEIREKYKEEIMEKINESYNFLTLMAVTPGKSFCIHGGLSRNINTLEELRNITKPYYKLDKILHNTYFQIQWNDPLEKIKGFSSSGRGDNIYQFGEDVVKQFLQKNQLKRIIRSHENSRGSYQKVFPNLIHIYSTGPYTDKKGSRKALIVHERKELINIIDLDLKIINK